MNRILCIMICIIMCGSLAIYKHMEQPESVATSVIAERGKGGKVAVLLPDQISNKQHQILNMAYEIGKKDHADPKIIQGIILQESKAGGMSVYRVAGNKGDYYYGLGQIKLSAAKDVLSKWPDLYVRYGLQTQTDEEITANLIMNNAFNIEVTSKYVKLLRTQYGYTGRTLINSYNRGPGGVKSVDSNFHYAVGVERHIAGLKS